MCLEDHATKLKSAAAKEKKQSEMSGTQEN